MSWRPDDWNNPYLDSHEYYLFEAGADAMLEALKALPTSVLLGVLYKKEGA